eukprot:TRINITY_DN108_c1_g2_i1.p2 TRINITY_DN108_c1_g2~~TRINITY_DN108_c1_g2_i1.p2  ORF type:complete len:105 (-),score=6.13 TRINITY_DN108_c1_g2_i1:392-706(-)
MDRTISFALVTVLVSPAAASYIPLRAGTPASPGGRAWAPGSSACTPAAAGGLRPSEAVGRKRQGRGGQRLKSFTGISTHRYLASGRKGHDMDLTDMQTNAVACT